MKAIIYGAKSSPDERPPYQGSNPISDLWSARALEIGGKYLRRAVEDGRFREDLFYRLNVIAIQLPPLRQRKEDIPALVNHFGEKYCRENGRTQAEVTPEALQVLLS